VTDDFDGNGKIDQITVTFSEPVNFNDTGAGTDALPGFTLSGGYTLANFDYGNLVGVTTITLRVTEGGSFDTGATPNVIYARSTGSLLDNNGNEEQDQTRSSADGAAPV